MATAAGTPVVAFAEAWRAFEALSEVRSDVAIAAADQCAEYESVESAAVVVHVDAVADVDVVPVRCVDVDAAWRAFALEGGE